MALNPYEDWPEALALTLLVLGFLIALVTSSVIVQYLIIILAGLVFGRQLHRWKPFKKSSLFLIMLGFLLGYMLGSVYANRKILLVLFFIGLWAGWYFEKKKYFRTATFT